MIWPPGEQKLLTCPILPFTLPTSNSLSYEGRLKAFPTQLASTGSPVAVPAKSQLDVSQQYVWIAYQLHAFQRNKYFEGRDGLESKHASWLPPELLPQEHWQVRLIQ